MVLPADYLWFWIVIAVIVILSLVVALLPVYILLWKILRVLGSKHETENRNSDELYRVR